ncbi:MAG: DUF6465 family protein [Eubacteriales bacterium]|nr:DUF6465 family protein [Eubacteriales bacterium]
MATKKAVTSEPVVKEAAKEPVKKAVDKKPVEKKASVEKKAAPVEKKAPAKKAAAKTAVKETVVLQYLGREISTADVMKKVKEYWTKELKNKVGDMKSVSLYLKPEENKAYFVINGDVTGAVEL